MNYTLTEAKQYAVNNKLKEWIQAFLRYEDKDMPNPNYGFADGLLLEERVYFGPMMLPLTSLSTVRIEKDITDANEVKWFNHKVDKIIEKLDEWDMPPLIAQIDEGRLVLTDGNHRFSALEKMNRKECAVILWGNKDQEDELRQRIEQNNWH